jgi:membrane-associated phospholipid phosphatase
VPPKPSFSSRLFRSAWQKRWRLLLIFAFILLPLFAFGEFAEDVWAREGFSWDEPLLRALHALETPLLNRVAVTITDLGSAPVMALLTVLLIGFFFYQKRMLEAWFVALALGGASSLNLIAKAGFQRQRPHLWEPIVPEIDFGFPSGHAMVSSAFAVTVILLLWPTRWRWLALIVGTLFALAVGTSRVYLGVHFGSDVAAGWCASLAWVIGVHQILRWRQRRHDARLEAGKLEGN